MTDQEFIWSLQRNHRCGRLLDFAMGWGFCGKPEGHKERCGDPRQKGRQ